MNPTELFKLKRKLKYVSKEEGLKILLKEIKKSKQKGDMSS